MDPLLPITPATAVAFAAILGLLLGSFLNVVIHRLPRMLEAEWQAQAAELAGQPAPASEPFNLMVPRSRCPHCGRPIRAIENVPVLSWLLLRGRCAGCGARIPARYPLVELLGGVAVALAAWRFGPTWTAAAAAALSLTLIALTFIDIDTQLLPDDLTLPLLWLGLLANLGGLFTDLPSAVIGAMAGYLLLWSVYWLFRLATGREGMGYGDFKLLAALGAWFGWQALPAIVLLASVVGALAGIALMVAQRLGRGVPMPFGPYLAGAGLLALYVREPLLAIYGIAP